MNKECHDLINFPTFDKVCPFIPKCKHDLYECDEKCSEHIKRGRAQERKDKLESLK